MLFRSQRRTNVLNEVLSSSRNIARYKAVLKQKGILAGAGMRAPLMPLEEKAAEEMLTRLEELRYTEVLA